MPVSDSSLSGPLEDRAEGKARGREMNSLGTQQGTRPAEGLKGTSLIHSSFQSLKKKM